MLSYDRLSRKPRLFKSFTGFSVKQFNDVYIEIESKYPEHEVKHLTFDRKDKIRGRAVGAGRHFKLVPKDRVIMVLIYYRLYITYSLTGFLFDLDQSNICRDIEKIEELIRSCLPIPEKLYNVTKRLKTVEEIEEYFPGFMAMIYCSEQPIPRPKNWIRRKIYYSGKKKKHTVKNLYTSNQNGLVVYKTRHNQMGKRHDYQIYKKNHPDLLWDVTSMYDLGFLGVEKEYQKQKSLLPIKKKKGCELTVHEKEYNRNHSAKRIVIEHAICRIKKYRIMNDVFRNRLRKYDKVSDIVSGLVNYRIINNC
ncbi:MAG: transposase family protein [Candidatus Nitrosocosmicus sp.]|nr:transposase [Candidatus Nitrosocosmicus sp.]